MAQLWVKSKILFSKIIHFGDKLIPYLIAIYLIWHWAPVAYRHFKIEGQNVPVVAAQSLEGELIDFTHTSKPKLLVFWATWCGPCTFELRRIQMMVDSGKIPREQVLAVTQETDLDLIRNEVRERAYSFPIGLDKDGKLAEFFEVTGTPTLVVLDPNNEIKWITSGLSPSLEIRLPGYFTESSN